MIEIAAEEGTLVAPVRRSGGRRPAVSGRSAGGQGAPLRDFAVFDGWVAAKADAWGFAPLLREGGGGEERDDDADLSGWRGWPALEVARRLLGSPRLAHRSLGMACLKAAAPVPEGMVDADPFEAIEPLAANLRTLVVGAFPNLRCWRDRGWPTLLVEPDRDGRVDWGALPQARSAGLVVATGQFLLRGGWGDLVRATPRARARVLVGPAVPPCPDLFRQGVHGLGVALAGDEGALLDHLRHGARGLRNAPAGAVRKGLLWCRPRFAEEILGKRTEAG